MIAERKGQRGELACPGPVRRLKVGLITVPEPPDRWVIAPVEPDHPGRLREKAIGDAGVVLHDDIGTGENQRSSLLELLVVEEVGSGLEQTRRRAVLADPLDEGRIELQGHVNGAGATGGPSHVRTVGDR